MPAEPPKFQSKFLSAVGERGFIHQCTDEAALDQLLTKGETNQAPVVCYIGFDCTAPSLHVGSLIQIMMLRHWQKAGHKPIVLMGGGTSKIGDPSGKDASRQLLTDEKIAENMAGIQKVFAKFLKFGEEPTDAVMLNNADWLNGLDYISFLRDYGRLFSVNRMLSMESVKQRLDRESHLSFLEFNYMILQAYDFLELNERANCRLQIGGSDQWGNIIQGVELARRKKDRSFQHNTFEGAEYFSSVRDSPSESRQSYIDDDGNEMLAHGNTPHKKTDESYGRFKSVPDSYDLLHRLYGLTTPLLTTASGTKMGKTASGAVWLEASMFSPYDYWQFWRNVEDADVGKFLRLFTELPLDEIARLEALPGQEINEAKKILASEATALLHGRDAAEKAAETARQTFEQGMTAESLPEVTVEIGEAIAAFQLFASAGLAASGGEARRLIQGGGARMNDEKIEDPTISYTRAQLEAMQPLKLSAGKKKHVLVKLI